MLGITKDATEKQLKTAYKKKCLKVHPDKNNAPNAEEAFKRISWAMSCLSDPKKRRKYDLGGDDGFFNQDAERKRRNNFYQPTYSDFASEFRRE